jgi:LysR family transcriptional regulator, glycine cleavage system transcriptional activator
MVRVPAPYLEPWPLPSLHGLRVFEAAARHMSFTEAARELCISQTAVSHQIKALENELGAPLFFRSPRRIELTEQGKAWALALGEVFSRLHAINRRLRESVRPARPEVAVSVIPSFGARWLVPRLGRFLAQNPEVEVRISPGERLVDFAREGIDLGIRYGSGRYPGLVTEKLADDRWLVVGAPALLAQRPLRSIADLERHVLLQDDAPDAWASWLAANGASTKLRARRSEITDSSMLVEAVLRGQGIGLARWSLCADELAAGRLSLAFPDAASVLTGLAYYVVAPRDRLRSPMVAAFQRWVLEEARALRAAGAREGDPDENDAEPSRPAARAARLRQQEAPGRRARGQRAKSARSDAATRQRPSRARR